MSDDNSEIPLLGAADAPSRGENAQSLLHEIVMLLKGLLARDEPAHIDLRALPLSRGDYVMLEELLGEGAIRAEIRDEGVTRIRQSGVAGIWWVTRYNEEEDVIGEFIEIAFCPEGLIVELEAVEEGVAALQARLLELEYLSRRSRKR